VFTGRSGSGKSTLFRAFAGIWPFGGGRVKPGSGNALFLPQRPYFPQGTLRDMLAYPAATDSFTEAEFTQALDDVGMSALSPELDLRDAWSHRLSGGEQQRVALARALLVKPDWLVLDEATASLDPQSEHDLLEMLKARLPDTTMVSIAHRPEVAAVHAKEFVVLRDGDTPAHVATVIAEPI
jgi:putative ATP-binding cassette transporter